MITSDREMIRGRKSALYNTLDEFRNYWDRIDVLCPGNRWKFSRQHSTQPFDNVFVHSSSMPLWLHWRWLARFGAQLAREHEIDVMTVQEYPPFYNGLGAAQLSRLTGIPYLLEIHHVPGYPRAGSLKERVYYIFSKLFLSLDARRAHTVRVVNHSMKVLLEKFGVPASKIKIISSLYLNTDIFKPDPSQEKKYDFIFVARLEKNKGIMNLIKAIALMREKNPDVSLLIAGNGSLKQDVEEFVRVHQLQKNITFAGWLPTLEDIAKTYRSARIFINPSFNEGGPRVVFEAMLCGVPVITTRVGLTLDLIKDVESGFFTDWNSLNMAATMSRLLNDTKLQEKFSKSGIKIASQFERTKMIKQYADAVKSLIK